MGEQSSSCGQRKTRFQKAQSRSQGQTNEEQIAYSGVAVVAREG
jgi:hypothetical protein